MKRDYSRNNESEIVVLEVYWLATDALYSYTRKFKNDGVSQKEMEEMHDLIKQEVMSVNVTGDKTRTLKEKIMERFGQNKTDLISRQIADVFTE